jgi:hypothetical protein
MGLEQTPQFSKYHHLLNRAQWSPMQLKHCLLSMLVETFVQAGGTLELVIDETLERRQGVRISKRGYDNDRARSTHQQELSSSGLRWVCLTLVVTPPWTKRSWALPFLSVLATSPEVDTRLGADTRRCPNWPDNWWRSCAAGSQLERSS